MAADAPPADAPYPHWVKASFGTAGRSVCLVRDRSEERAAIRELAAGGESVIGQAPTPGEYGQVQALFDHGRLIAVHTSVQTGTGAGASAAARRSVDHPIAREHAARLGAHLAWHGGLTLDYLHLDGRPQFIECNPRTVEPGNAAAAGVNLPALTIALASGAPLPERLVVGRPGVRTRSALALAMGVAEREASRRAILRVLLGSVRRHDAAEVLTPIRRDPPSVVPLAVVTARLLTRPADARRIARGAVADYAVTPAAIRLVRSSRDGRLTR